MNISKVLPGLTEARSPALWKETLRSQGSAGASLEAAALAGSAG